MRNHHKYVGVIALAAGVLAGGFIYVDGWEHAPEEGPTPCPQPELFMMMTQAGKEQCRGQLHSIPVLPLTPSLPALGD